MEIQANNIYQNDKVLPTNDASLVTWGGEKWVTANSTDEKQDTFMVRNNLPSPHVINDIDPPMIFGPYEIIDLKTYPKNALVGSRGLKKSLRIGILSHLTLEEYAKAVERKANGAEFTGAEVYDLNSYDSDGVMMRRGTGRKIDKQLQSLSEVVTKFKEQTPEDRLDIKEVREHNRQVPLSRQIITRKDDVYDDEWKWGTDHDHKPFSFKIGNVAATRGLSVRGNYIYGGPYRLGIITSFARTLSYQVCRADGLYWFSYQWYQHKNKLKNKADDFYIRLYLKGCKARGYDLNFDDTIHDWKSLLTRVFGHKFSEGERTAILEEKQSKRRVRDLELYGGEPFENTYPSEVEEELIPCLFCGAYNTQDEYDNNNGCPVCKAPQSHETLVALVDQYKAEGEKNG